jgi:hypothetical protein
MQSDNSWVVLDESRPESRGSVGSAGDTPSRARAPSRGSRFSETDREWESYARELLPIRRTPDGLKAAHSLGLDYHDSLALAERSLGLAVRLDGVDPEFLRRSTETIEALQRSRALMGLSPALSERGDVESCEEGDEQPEPGGAYAAASASAGALLYGGRAPPRLGALAPRVRSPPCCGAGLGAGGAGAAQAARLGSQLELLGGAQLAELGALLQLEPMLPELHVWAASDQDRSERRRQRLEQRAREGPPSADASPRKHAGGSGAESDNAEKKALGASPASDRGGEGGASGVGAWLRRVLDRTWLVPLVVSHILTLALGFYIGGRHALSVQASAA